MKFNLKLNRLGARILAVVIVLLVVSVGGIGFYAMQVGGRGLQDAARQYETTLSENLAYKLNSTFNRFDGMLQALSALVTTRFTSMPNPEVADIVIPQFGAQNGRFMNDLGVQSPEARSLFIIFNPDVFGTAKTHMVGFQRKDANTLFMYIDEKTIPAAELVDRKNPSTSWFWTPLDTKRPYWADVSRTEDGGEIVTYAMPVLIGEDIVAVAGMTFDFSFVRETLKAVKIYDSGYPFLMNRNLKYLYHPTLSFDGPGFREVSNGYFAKYADDILNKGKGRIDYPWENDQKTMSYYTMENGYILFVSASIAESLAAVGAMQRAVYIGIAAVLLVAVVVVIVFSRSLAKPLQAVAAGARNVAETGDLTKTLS
ncbi:MAG: Cache 3/Cache 2 fusion domain-containing protein, partial [Synergistaceae bacterium]|nr:Cache 3/Cache 2 fusion domain-containing protein [Synergistaceae bacterium]